MTEVVSQKQETRNQKSETSRISHISNLKISHLPD